ncbi:hypothetical protein [Amaricoccus sp.]|uniref:hypothetical protein n=1 Tax=Amaricoccus sp. TaxID=1872485 RepID=UPI002626E411|nr:hypothetical protein [Amaricoccus sp.]HRO10322.1 hypothetical protein [Amaricoccus sp.]
MPSTIANERTKLLANALDRASTACLAVGVLAPLAAVSHVAAPQFSLGLIVSLIGWFLAAIVLHLRARRTLGGLRT